MKRRVAIKLIAPVLDEIARSGQARFYREVEGGRAVSNIRTSWPRTTPASTPAATAW